jgi:hypothetical protein
VSRYCAAGNGLRPRTTVEGKGRSSIAGSFFKGILQLGVSFGGLATRSLEAEPKSVEQSLALPYAEGYGVLLSNMVRQ